MKIFNERYLPLIERSGKSDSELEKAMDLPRSIIYDWKHGRNKGYKKYADKFAAYFNISTDYLLGNDTSQIKDPPTDNDIKFALFGTAEVDDALYDDVKRLAKSLYESKQDRKNK